MSVFRSKWEDWGKDTSQRTAYQGTSITDKSTFDGFVGSLPGHIPRNSVNRCPRCRELEAEGVRTLICSTCGYQEEQRAPRAGPEDLRFSKEHVHARLSNLSPAEREAFDYWMDLMLEVGWSRDEAQRGAYARVVDSQNNKEAPQEN